MGGKSVRYASAEVYSLFTRFSSSITESFYAGFTYVIGAHVRLLKTKLMYWYALYC